MKGHKFLKVTGILMIIAAVFSIIAGVLVGGLGVLAAGLGAESGLTFPYWAALFLTLVGGICQMIAGIKGIKHSKRSEKAGKLIVWGAIVAVFSVLSIVMSLVNGGEFNVVSVLTGIAIPALYIYGAVLNVSLRIASGRHPRSHCGRRRNIYGTGIDLEAYFVKVIVVDEYGDVEIIGVFIPRGIVTDLPTVLILTFKFRAALVNVEITAGHVCKIQNIRVGFREISGTCHHEFSRVLVKKHLGVRAERSGCVECRDLFLVFFPVIKLCLDFLNSAVASIREPRGKLLGAVFAEIAVFKLAVAK